LVPEFRRRSEVVEAEMAIWITAFRALAIIGALVSLGWALRRMRLEAAEQLERLVAAQQQARAETHALSERMSALITLVAAIPARVERQVEAPPPPVKQRRESNPVRSYETARRLARNGASIEEIVATCGMADTEARLLRRLHGAESRREDAA
jgi:Protein of unknown function (DUF2802)